MVKLVAWLVLLHCERKKCSRKSKIKDQWNKIKSKTSFEMESKEVRICVCSIWQNQTVQEWAKGMPYGHNWTDGFYCTATLHLFSNSLCLQLKWMSSIMFDDDRYVIQMYGCTYFPWQVAYLGLSLAHNILMLLSVGCRHRREPGLSGLWRILFIL